MQPRPAISSVVFVATWLLLAIATIAAEPDPEADSVDRDYSKELPRIKPVESADALATFKVAPGFRLELVAHEPLVVDPIAMSFDEDGRLFVVEMRDYSEQGEDKLGRIRLLTDDNGDGKFDSSTVYAEGLSWPTAVCCWNGGVFVAAAPDLWFCKDTNGDGRAEVQEKIFTGFGRSNVQGLVNTLLWGPDNRIHGATSSSGASLTRVDSTAKPDEKPLVLSGRDFSFDPRTYDLRAESGGGQHGMSFNDWGEKFVSSNSDHLQMIVCEDRYLARNPFYAAPSPRISIAADGGQADVFRASAVEPWRIVRTRLRVSGVTPGIIEGGGKPAGYFTGATGVTIYRGSASPELYGCAIVGDVGSNLVHRKKLEPNGLTYIGRRIDEKSELIASTDNWFRPVQFANGPDGTLYIADMYREVIEHPASLPPVIKKHLDLTSGRDRGRIYRLVPEGFKQPRVPQLSGATAAELVQSLTENNAWQRETAERLLYGRQDRSAVGELNSLIDIDDSPPTARVAALTALAGLQTLSTNVVLEALRSNNTPTCVQALRCSEALLDDPAIVEQLCSIGDAIDVRVRFQLALTLGNLRDGRRIATMVRLLRASGNEPWIASAVMTGMRDDAGELLTAIAHDQKLREFAIGNAMMEQLAQQIGKQQDAADVAAVLKLVAPLAVGDDAEQRIAKAIIEHLNAQGELAAQVAAAAGGQADQWRKELVERSRAVALNDKLSDDERVAAIHRLSLSSFADEQKSYEALLRPESPRGVQQAAIRALSRSNDAAVADWLLARWPTFGPQLRVAAIETLLARDVWVRKLLPAIERKAVSASEIPTARLQALAARDDAEITRPAWKLLEERAARRSDVLDRYVVSLDEVGDVERGRALFTKHCSACHKLGDVGHEIGPNLASAATRGPESLLVNVLDPNREVNPQYANYIAVTKDGRSASGILAGETATSITLLRGEKASDTLLRVDIEELKSTGTSLMPEGFEKEIDPAAMNDLLAFLRRSP